MERHSVRQLKCFQRKHFHIKSHNSCPATLSIKMTAAGSTVYCIFYIFLIHSANIHTRVHTCMCAYTCTLSFIVFLSPCFFCFLQLLSYTEMQNDSFFCLVQTCFPLSLTTEFKSSDFGCRGALSLVAFLFFQVFLIL